MACQKRESTGNCNHYQCPFHEETPYGYECVEIWANKCESGLNCLSKCPYSFTTEEAKEIEKKQLEEIELMYPL